MNSFKKKKRNIFESASKVEKTVCEKPQFMTKMNVMSLHNKYHPTDHVDIPKVEISTGGSTPVSVYIPNII